jgi:hypothetical protein
MARCPSMPTPRPSLDFAGAHVSLSAGSEGGPSCKFRLTMGWTDCRASPEPAVCAISKHEVVAGSAALLTRCIAGMHRNAAVW